MRDAEAGAVGGAETGAARGAEAVIKVDGGRVLKDRVRKSYRLPEIDSKLRTERTKREAKLIEDARRAGVPVPRIFSASEHGIEMELIGGKTLRDSIGLRFAKQVGASLAKLHDINIVHGDLTTSNMVVRGGIVHFIDFGLGFHTKRVEDKAVDLHLLERALDAKHPKVAKRFFAAVVRNYNPKSKREILERLSVIEGRGRYK